MSELFCSLSHIRYQSSDRTSSPRLNRFSLPSFRDTISAQGPWYFPRYLDSTKVESSNDTY